MLFAETFHEILVAVGLLATKVEVAVDGLDVIVKLLENEEQCHAIGAAAECYEMQSVMGK
jgi:hypothetical protein